MIYSEEVIIKVLDKYLEVIDKTPLRFLSLEENSIHKRGKTEGGFGYILKHSFSDNLTVVWDTYELGNFRISLNKEENNYLFKEYSLRFLSLLERKHKENEKALLSKI